MKRVSLTEFRKNISSFIDEVEHGETVLLLRRRKPVGEVSPFSGKPDKIPAWKKPVIRLKLNGSDLSSTILDERESIQ
ncbi:MAG: type II toxin-antitoxin system Phd/YefM family antitoxin [Deltaproteobacteria bacterium]|nr:type II toxin-antitoxin system Phd/YefM family antitoxin [Deltaproteobacteria bacterium]